MDDLIPNFVDNDTFEANHSNNSNLTFPRYINLHPNLLGVVLPVIEHDPHQATDSPTLCGVPGICWNRARKSCFNVTFGACEDCPSAFLGLFVFFLTILAIAILLGNFFVLQVTYNFWRKGKLTNFDKFRASMAIADLLAGFQIFFVTFPNLVWTGKSTIKAILDQEPLFENSAQSIVGGLIYIVGYVASLYNLLILGAARLYAIRCPQKYRQLSHRKVLLGIGGAWILSLVVSSIPGWFPQYLYFEYHHVTFLYLATLNLSSDFYAPAIAWLILTLLIPYILLTIELIITAIFVRAQLSKSRKKLHQSITNGKHFSHQEISAFVTVSLMQIGFTVTLIPVGIVSVIFYTNYLNCDTFSTPYLICFYLGLTNSLVNVLVYSLREQKFRTEICESLKKLNPLSCCHA